MSPLVIQRGRNLSLPKGQELHSLFLSFIKHRSECSLTKEPPESVAGIWHWLPGPWNALRGMHSGLAHPPALPFWGLGPPLNIQELSRNNLKPEMNAEDHKCRKS